ncbi:hypothetical protein VTL71DRAFT_13926 [Oculimacula yallundae]|uniref:Uncharacterized protein n=1 Tax=Oculimacula yallundae TaxID=86028 RepID=A0ABR4CM59_9HELO
MYRLLPETLLTRKVCILSFHVITQHDVRFFGSENQTPPHPSHPGYPDTLSFKNINHPTYEVQ